jgi:hypothetical protein
VQNKVDVYHELMSDWRAFWALSTDRPSGLAQGAIPWSSLDRYAQRYAIAGDEFDRFVAMMRAMDAAFLAYKKEP